MGANFIILKKKYYNRSAIYNVINYILDPKKNPYGVFHASGNSHKDIQKIAYRFEKVQKIFRKENRNRIIHMLLTFPYDCHLSYEEYLSIGYHIIDFFSDDHQCIFALHLYDNEGKYTHPHIHIAVNPVSYRTGKRLRLDKKMLHEIHKYVDTLLPNYE